MADVYLTNKAVNMTLTSSFNASVEPLLAPLDLPAPTQVPSRLLHASPEDNSLTLQLGPSSLLVKLRVTHSLAPLLSLLLFRDVMVFLPHTSHTSHTSHITAGNELALREHEEHPHDGGECRIERERH
jgi:hypothetical protein